MSASETSQISSIIISRYSSASSCRSAGISISVQLSRPSPL